MFFNIDILKKYKVGILSIALLLGGLNAGAQESMSSKTVVIASDWHLSDIRSVEGGWSLTERNQVRIEKFLHHLEDTKDAWDVLVLNGDIFELWRTPASVLMQADDKGAVLSNAQYIARIADHNKSIFDTLYRLRDVGKELVYLPGNHDMTVKDEDLALALPDLFVTKYDTPSTGVFFPMEEVAIEHGNRYEVFNSPDPISHLDKEGMPDGFVIPPGFFTAKLGATAAVLQKQLGDVSVGNTVRRVDAAQDILNKALYTTFWATIAQNAEVTSLSVMTGVDGYNAICRWGDYSTTADHESALFKDCWKQSVWESRCEMNKVPVVPSFSDALMASVDMDICDNMAFLERLNNEQQPSVICVFGHTHRKLIDVRHDDLKGDVIYMNVGAWVDDHEDTSFGVVTYDVDSHVYTVSLNECGKDGKVTVRDERRLYVPESFVVKDGDGWIFSGEKCRLMDDEPNNVCGISNDDKSLQLYNLCGQRVGASYKGIVVKRGKKCISKF